MNNMREFRRIAICKELVLVYDLIEGDVYDGNVNLYQRGDPNILIKFSQLEIRKVNGWFDCNDNNLTSLKGCPEIVKGYFDCNDNNLTSLEGCPKKVGGKFYGYWNDKKFERPTDCDIGGSFHG